MRSCNDKREYRKAVALVMRVDGWNVADVAERLGVTEKTVCVWTAVYRTHGIARLKRRKGESVLIARSAEAGNRLPVLLASAPEQQGVLNGRWTVLSLSRPLATEGAGIGS